MIKLGFHMSIAGSLANAPKCAIENGYPIFQLFTANSRSWTAKDIEPGEAREFRSIVKRHGIIPYAHIPYLSNPSSANKDVRSNTVAMMLDNVARCNTLGVKYLVIHIGSHLGAGLERGIENTCIAVGEVIEKTSTVDILLENTSGYRNSVGSKFGEIGKIIDALGSSRVGVCLDTCHTFAAGYDLSTAEGIDRAVGEFDSLIGLSRMRLVHLNDSKYDLGSTLDRHWHIGKGYIGMRGFTALFRNKAFDHGSFIMETPINEAGDNRTNLAAARQALQLAGKQVER